MVWPGVSHDAADAGDVDDAAVAGPHHVARGGPGEQERAAEVGVDHRRPSRSSLMRGSSVSRVTPALLTRMSILPHFSARPSIISLSTAAPVLHVAGNASACPPAAVIDATVSASLSAVAGDAGDLRPGFCRARCAIALPSPCEAPVTTAVWPERSTLRES